MRDLNTDLALKRRGRSSSSHGRAVFRNINASICGKIFWRILVNKEARFVPHLIAIQLWRRVTVKKQKKHPQPDLIGRSSYLHATCGSGREGQMCYADSARLGAPGEHSGGPTPDRRQVDHILLASANCSSASRPQYHLVQLASVSCCVSHD